MKHPTASGIYAKVWRVRVWIVSLFLILIYIFIFRFKLVQKPDARFVKKVKMKWQPLPSDTERFQRGESPVIPTSPRPWRRGHFLKVHGFLVNFNLPWVEESVSTRIVMMFLPWIYPNCGLFFSAKSSGCQTSPLLCYKQSFRPSFRWGHLWWDATPFTAFVSKMGKSHLAWLQSVLKSQLWPGKFFAFIFFIMSVLIFFLPSQLRGTDCS
jgi:hypothetical protein